MIRFDNWSIQADGDILARQFDNLTRTLTVTGDIPAGWEWAVLVQVGEAMDIIPLTATESALSAVLTAQQLSIAGYYNMQLRATQGDKVKHTNTVNVYIPASLSGDEQWPTVPSEFTDLERRVNEKAVQVEGYTTHPPIIGENSNWWVWDGEKYIDTGTRAKCEIDSTLSVEGKAADAKATGKALDSKVNKNGDTMTGPLRFEAPFNTGLKLFSGRENTVETIYPPGVDPDTDYEGDVEYRGAYGEPSLYYTNDSDARVCYDDSLEAIFIQLPDITSGGEDTEYYTKFRGATLVLSKKYGMGFLPSGSTSNSPVTGAYKVIHTGNISEYVDKTLAMSGKLAEAKATGDALKKKIDLTGGTVTGPIYYKSTSNQFLRTDNIVSWAITNMDTWTPFFSSFNIGRVQKKSYTGTGVYGQENAKTLTFDFTPKVVIIKKKMSIPLNNDGTERVTGINEVLMVAFYGETASISSVLHKDPSYTYCTHLSWSGKSMTWWGMSDTRHLNIAGVTYNVLAIG